MLKKISAVVISLFLLLFLFSSCGEMQHGSISASGYTNTWAGIFVPFPEGWECVSGEELSQQLGVSQTDTLGQAAISYEFYIEKSDGYPSLIMTIEDLSATEGAEKFNAGDYLDFIAQGLEAEQEVSFMCTRSSSVKIAGEKYETLSVVGTYGSATLSQSYFARRIDRYVVCFVAANRGTDFSETDDVIYAITKPE